MKTFITSIAIISFFCVTSKVFCQTTFTDTVKIRDSYSDNHFVSAFNGDFLTAQRFISPDSSNSDDIYCARIKTDGKAIWEKIFSTPGLESKTKLFSTSDNGVIIFANSYNKTSSEYAGLIIKCDSLGNIKWSKKITGLEKVFDITPVQIIEEADESIICFYDLNVHELFEEVTLNMIKFSSSGKFLMHSGFKKIYNAKDDQYYHTNAVIPLSDGGFGIALEYSCSECENGPRSYFMRLNKKGGLVSYKAVYPEMYSYYDYSTPISIIEKDKKLFVLGFFFAWDMEPKRTDYYYWQSLDRNGNASAATLIPYDKFALQKFLKENNIDLSKKPRIFFNKNSSVVLFDNKYNMVEQGYLPLGTAATKLFYISGFDSSGKICPVFSTPVFNYDTLSRPPLTEPEISGVKHYTDTFAISDIVVNVSDTTISKTSCSEKMPSSITSATSVENISIATEAKIYPNPAKNNIFISYNSHKTGMTYLYVSGTDGKIVQVIKVNSQKGINMQSINIPFLTKGVYFIKIMNDDKQTVLKFLKE